MPEPTGNFKEETQEKDSGVLNKTFSRRDFLRGMALAGLALGATACNIDTSEGSEGGKRNLRKNVEDLNKQFGEIEKQYLDENDNFNYQMFSPHPDFERYTPDIRGWTERLGNDLEINPNALKVLTSSIIVANLGNWDDVDRNRSKNDPKEDRLGPMQFYPSNALNTIENRLKDKHNYSTQELEGIFNIEVGLKHLVHGCLADIENNGINRNLLSLTLAQYYGGKRLLNFVKSNEEPPEDDLIRENYNLYRKTLGVMGIQQRVVKVEGSQIEKGPEGVWARALEHWPNTKLAEAKEYFFQQAKKYAEDKYNKEKLHLSEEQYLALFVSITMAESNGGTERGPHPISGARGWFQVIPEHHLEEYNRDIGRPNGKEYNNDQLLNDTEASIEVGAWSLMRYRHSDSFPDIKSLMKYFKAGGVWDNDAQAGLWWNRISYCTQRLLGSDELNLGYIDYLDLDGVPREASYFESSDDVGRMRTAAEKKKMEEEKAKEGN